MHLSHTKSAANWKPSPPTSETHLQSWDIFRIVHTQSYIVCVLVRKKKKKERNRQFSILKLFVPYCWAAENQSSCWNHLKSFLRSKDDKQNDLVHIRAVINCPTRQTVSANVKIQFISNGYRRGSLGSRRLAHSLCCCWIWLWIALS